MKPGCPFCSNFAVWLASAGLNDTFEWQFDTSENRALIAGKCANGKVTFPTIQYEQGKFMNETFDLMRHVTKEHGVDNSKLVVWRYMTQPSNEGSGGASLMERYWLLLGFAKEHHNGSLDKVKAAVFGGDRIIPALVPPDIDEW